MIEAKDINYGLCCTSCQENLNIHACMICGKDFEEDGDIVCINHSHTDNQHYHKRCKK